MQRSEDKEKLKVDLAWVLKDVEVEERGSVFECALPFLQGVTDRDAITAIIEALKNIETKEERKSVSDCLAPITREIVLPPLVGLDGKALERPDGKTIELSDLIPNLIQYVSAAIETADRKSISQGVVSFIREIPDRRLAPLALSNVINALTSVKEDDMKSFAKFAAPLLYQFAVPLLQDFTPFYHFLPYALTALTEVKVDDRKSFSDSAALLLQGVSPQGDLPGYAINALFIKELANVKAENWESVARYAPPLLQAINYSEKHLQQMMDDKVILNTLQALEYVSASERESVSKYAAPLLKKIKKGTDGRSILLLLQRIEKVSTDEREAFSQCATYFLRNESSPDSLALALDFLNNCLAGVKAEERKSVAKYAAPLLQWIAEGENVSNILRAIEKINADEREAFSMCASYLLRGDDNEYRAIRLFKTVIGALVDVKVEDRKSVAKYAAPLLQGIKDDKEILNILRTARDLNEKYGESFFKFAAPFLPVITDGKGMSNILRIFMELNPEDRETLTLKTNAYFQNADIDVKQRRQVLLNFFDGSNFIPSQYFEKLLECCIESAKGNITPMEMLFTNQEVQNASQAYMLERLQEDENMEPNHVQWLSNFAKKISDHATKWGINPDTDLFKKVKDLENKYNPTRFVVDYQLLKSNPEQILRYLSLKIDNGQYPHVNFMDENKQVSEGIDSGGLKRQLQGTLFENLFNDVPRDKKLPFFKVVKVVDEEERVEGDEEDEWVAVTGVHIDVLPQVRIGQDEFANDKRSYHNIGKLLAVAYSHEKSLLTGVHFNPGLMRALAALTQNEMKVLASIDIQSWKDLPEPVLCKIFAGLDPTYSGIAKPADQRKENEQTLYLEFMTIRDDDYNEIGKHADLRAAIEHYANEHKEMPFAEIIPAIAIAAQGMYSSLPDEKWEKISQLGAEKLSEKIQGITLTYELVLAQLRWEGPRQTDERIQGFLKEWLRLNKDNREELKRFVMAVTGDSSLNNQKKLNISLINQETPDLLPTASTCFNTMHLSTNFTSQEKFIRQMNTFLDNALAGTGFSMT